MVDGEIAACEAEIINAHLRYIELLINILLTTHSTTGSAASV